MKSPCCDIIAIYQINQWKTSPAVDKQLGLSWPLSLTTLMGLWP